MRDFFASERYFFWQFLYKFTRSGEPNAVLLILFVPSLFFIPSCSPVFYAPGPQQMPGFTRAPETRINIGYTATAVASGVEANVLHAPIEHLTLAAGHISYTAFTPGKTSPYHGYGSISELGLGYHLWPSKNRHLVFDHCFFWGYGNFMVRSSHASRLQENYHIGSKLRRLSQVAGLTFRSRFFEAGLSLKLAYLFYYEPTRSRHSPPSYVQTVVERNRHFLAEPCLTLTAGPAFLKFYFCLEASKNLSHPHFPQEKQKLSFGVLTRF